MFRCKECQTEYEIKPDYCDCGNDTFDEIIEKQEKEPTIEKVEPPEVATTEIKKIVENEEIKQEKQVFEEQKTEQIIQKQEEIKQIAPKIQQEKSKNIDNYALLTFLICIILSLVIIFYPIKQTTEQNPTTQKAETKQTETIPDIESFWNGEISKNISTEEKQAEKEQQIDTQKETKIKTNDTKTVQKKEQKQKEVKQKEVKQTKSNRVKTQTDKKSSNVTKTTPSVKQNVQKQTQTKTSTANPQEIARYKVRLRNYIASKIDFARVVGDGSCSFSFRVTSNGTLIDKKAGYISDNDSLNEVVYNALRQTSSFNAPPTGYNSNSTLKLYVKMQGGAFEVSLN